MAGSVLSERQMTLLQALMRERHLTREQTVDLLDGRARAMGIRDFALSLRQLDRWLAGAVRTEPRPSVSRVVEGEFGRPIDELLAPAATRAGGVTQSTASDTWTHRQLRTIQFVEWVADHSVATFEDVYASVAQRADSLEALSLSRRLAVEQQRSRVGRHQIAEAVDAYYGSPAGLYQVTVGDQAVALTVLSRPDWLGLDVPLSAGAEPPHSLADGLHTGPRLETLGVGAAVQRLARVELADTVMVDQPIYRLLDIHIADQQLNAVFGLADFAAYAMTSDLLEEELLDSIVANHGELVLRDLYLPDVDAALALETRVCAGGPVCLTAVARPSGDYALLIQERSNRVLNVAGRLAVIPKAFHQPMADHRSETTIVATVERELEEELLGREDLDQLSCRAQRRIAPEHRLSQSGPMAWLCAHPDSYEVGCTGFGINLVTGNYEVACVVVIDDIEWWEQHGHQVEANWEATRLRCVSSRDSVALTRIVADPRWSNEGLFALIEGMRWLETHRPGQVAVPEVQMSAP